MSNPQFILTDTTHFIGAYLPKAAFDRYRKSKSKQLISKSKDCDFLITDWYLELVKVDSQGVYTSYADREVRLIINDLKLSPSKEVVVEEYVENIHRDNDVKLQVARLNLQEVREITELIDCGELSRFEESRKKTLDKS